MMKNIFPLMMILWMILIAFSISCELPNTKHSNAAALNGSELFKIYCVNCHGINGTLQTNGAKNLEFSELSLEERILIISEGRNVMTSFKNVLTPVQIEKVSKHTMKFKNPLIHGE